MGKGAGQSQARLSTRRSLRGRCLGWKERSICSGAAACEAAQVGEASGGSWVTAR